MAKHLTTKGGFTLLELLIYLSVFTVVAGLFLNIFVITARVQVRETADTEVSSQLQFAMQTIQRLIRESSAAYVANLGPCLKNDLNNVNSPYPCLRLRMRDSLRDPTCIAVDEGTANNPADNKIKILTGPAADPKECSQQNAMELTTGKVSLPDGSLPFRKFTNYPGHDTIQIDLTLNYVGGTSPLSKTLRSAVGRVSAATFDSGLIPGGTSGSLDIGSGSTLWKDLYINNINASGYLNVTGNTTLNGTFSEPNNYDDATAKGAKIIGMENAIGRTCNSACSNHGLVCRKSVSMTGSVGACGTAPIVPVYCWCD